jgi:hypothetical protein
MKNSSSVRTTLEELMSPVYHPIGATMSVAPLSVPINSPALLLSIRRFVDEMEERDDHVEIASVEWALWDIVLEHDLRRHKAPPAKLPRVRRIES